MKTKYIYLILLLSFSAFCALIVSYATPEIISPLKIRSGEMSLASDWLNTKKAIEGMLVQLEGHPDDMKTRLNLALAYIQEGRTTGDHAYYDPAALTLLDDILKKDPNHTEALCAKATVLLSQHHFAEAIPLGEKARILNPYNSGVYGILTDANVELGQYDAAIRFADKMVSVRPDIRSYSRISYLREIHGDITGAISAMKLAVEAGYPGLEQTEWCRVQLGHLFENTGNLNSAQTCYEEALYFRPAYAYAFLGMGRIEKARKHFKEAINYIEKAKSLVADHSFDHELTDVYRISNEPQKAYASAQHELILLDGMSNSGKGNIHGHYADRELAFAYLDLYQYSKALKHALIEYNRRPGNIDVNQTLAWVYYKLGRYEEANKYVKVH